MQRVTGITLDAINNIAKVWGYQNAQWVFPLLKQKILWQGVSTHVHVCRLGVNEHAQYISDLLIYIDGFGGVTCEVPTDVFFKNKKRLKVLATVQGDTMRIDFNPTEKELKAELVWENQWGYYDLSKTFVPVDVLPEGPIKLKHNEGAHTETVSVEDFIHPNVLTLRPEDMEAALNIFSLDFSKNECLHDNWRHPETNEAVRKQIESIIDDAVDINAANENFYAWWQSPAHKLLMSAD